MSTTGTPANTDAETLTNRIEKYLIDAVGDGHGYFRSKDIASDLDIRTRQVAAVIKDVDKTSNQISIEKWAYSNCTTWLVEGT